MTHSFSNLIAALLLAAVPHAVQAADWPQRRGIGNDGISAETNWVHTWPKEGPPIRWKTSVGTGFSSIAVVQGSAYTAGNTGEVDSVFCLNAEDGSIKWKFSYDEPLAPTMYEGGPNSTPTVDGTALYVASRSGKVFRLDARSGKEVWRRNLEEYVGQKNGKWGVGGSPLVVGSRLYINYGAAIVALDAASGQPVWQSAREPKSETSFNTPVLADINGDKTLFALMNEALFAVSADDGKLVWRHAYGSGYKTHCSDVIATPKGIFISSGDDGGELLALEKAKPKSLWKNKNLSTFTGSPVLVDGHLFGVNAAGYKKGKQELRCIELAKGDVKWALPEFGQDSLIAAGDRLLVLKERGELLVVRATSESGEILARAQVIGGKCWTQPALSDGLLYCRNAKGQVVCVDLRPSKS